MDLVTLWWQMTVLSSGMLIGGLVILAMRAYEGTKP